MIFRSQNTPRHETPANVTDPEVLLIDDDVISPAPASTPHSLSDVEAAAIVSELSSQVVFAVSQLLFCALRVARVTLSNKATRALQKLVHALPLGKSSGNTDLRHFYSVMAESHLPGRHVGAGRAKARTRGDCQIAESILFSSITLR